MLDFSNNCKSSHNSSTAPWNSSYKKVHTKTQLISNNSSSSSIQPSHNNKHLT